MKVTRKQLLKQLIPFFEEMGYTYFKDTISVAQGLFAKKIDDRLYVSVGVITSYLYYNTFTCNFYMAQSLDFAFLYLEDKSKTFEEYPRPGDYLSEDELIMFRGKDSKITDIWWHSDDAGSIESFKEAVRLAEPRFINNFDLRNRMLSNADASHRYDMANKVKELVKNGVPDFEPQFAPVKEKDGIPMVWFTAAELVCRDGPYFNKFGVQCLAADAYRRFVLDELM